MAYINLSAMYYYKEMKMTKQELLELYKSKSQKSIYDIADYLYRIGKNIRGGI